MTIEPAVPLPVNIYELLYRTFQRLLRGCSGAVSGSNNNVGVRPYYGRRRYAPVFYGYAGRAYFSKIGRNSSVYTEPVIYIMLFKPRNKRDVNGHRYDREQNGNLYS